MKIGSNIARSGSAKLCSNITDCLESFSFPSGGAAPAARMATFAVDVGRFFHGFALRAAIFLPVTHGTRTIGVRTFFVIRHW
jgi:hypothetical protein